VTILDTLDSPATAKARGAAMAAALEGVVFLKRSPSPTLPREAGKGATAGAELDPDSP